MPKPPSHRGRRRRYRRASTILDMRTTENAKQQMEEADLSSNGVNKENSEERPAKRAKHKHVTSDKISERIGQYKAERCDICLQKIDTYIKIYEGPPNDSLEESIALIDKRLSLYTGDEDFVDTHEFPHHRLTHFSVFDRNNHLCAFDTGLVDKNVKLYFSGYIKPIYEENPLPEDGVPAQMMGPIVEWSIAGFDGGELALVYIKSQYAEYVLMEPSPEYVPFFMALREKSYLSKYIIQFLSEEIDPTYEDLLNKLQTIVPPNNLNQFTEEALLRHAQFICDQVLSIDAGAEEEEDLLITTSCMRTLVSLAGVTLGRSNALHQIKANRPRKTRHDLQTWTKATTTRLVKNIFEHFFTDQLVENDDEISKKRKVRCGVCGHCQSPECGECAACKDMVKFGGTGKTKQACTRRRCPNMAIKLADESEGEEDDQPESMTEREHLSQKIDTKTVKELRKTIAWLQEKIGSDRERTFYLGVTIGEETIKVHDYVLIEPNNSSDPPYVAKVVYMWEAKNGLKMFHANWFYRGNETILEEVSHLGELFLSDQCDNLPISSIQSKCTVIHKNAPEDWAELGNTDLNVEDEKKYKDGKTFFYQKRYLFETGRFEDPLLEPEHNSMEDSHCFCSVCAHIKKLTEFNTPKVYEQIEDKGHIVTYRLVQYKGQDYTFESAVFLDPKAFDFKYKITYSQLTLKRDYVDPELYTEYYRKTEYQKGSNRCTPDPFCIGCINEIYVDTTKEEGPSPDDIYIKINKLYRPENTHKGFTLAEQEDLNKLYWSDEVCTIKFVDIVGKCYLAYSENIMVPIEDWSDAGPYRFYFSEAYNIKQKTFEEPSSYARALGRTSSFKGSKGSIKGKKSKTSEKKELVNKPIEYKALRRKLRTLDVFSGCGGLSEGLHQSGISQTLWAIEKVTPAGNAFRLNNPQATVFIEDCNILLKDVMDGKTKDKHGQKLPQKGEVEMLCGGPPCQGFSGMNRFNQRQYSLFKNSLVVSFLSYCDYYRPKFFIMENVHNFLSFKKNMVLKLTLSCLIRMGYQCAFDSLQAGNYGVAQTRRRMILLAAAPGEILPKYPEAMHTFSPRVTKVNLLLGKKHLKTTRTWISAPYRTITIKDTLYDLPEIPNGCSKLEMLYTSEPVSHFQRKIRGKKHDQILRDHICKNMNPLVSARISYIPLTFGDWRDLPNISIIIDGLRINKLEYTHDDKKMGRTPAGALRGVCSCAEMKKCDPTDRQFNTLIPWCLPHTGERHNHWSGLYGRLQWDGFFSTTITNPEPMGKQGRVLHPVQNRVVSVRECARSQGFPDSFRFNGDILNKHRQVGNAVPPPLAAAIGHEIRKCIRDTDVIHKIESAPTEDVGKPTTSRNNP